MIGAGGRASTLADDSTVLLRFVRVDGLDGSCSVKLADDAVVNGIPHKVCDLRHPTAPESERGDCLRCTTLSRDSLRAVDTASAGFRSSTSLLCGCRLLAASGVIYIRRSSTTKLAVSKLIRSVVAVSRANAPTYHAPFCQPVLGGPVASHLAISECTQLAKKMSESAGG